jgi:hypothetical protein
LTDSSLQKVVLSGLRIHLGNYFGAIRNWVALQERYRCYYFAADWHALTTDYADPSQIADNTLEAVGRLARGRPRPRALGDLHPVAGARTRRAPPAALDAHAARLAGAGADLQGPAAAAREQGPGDLRLPRLPGAADGGHHHLPRRLRAGGGGPDEPPRAVARDRPPLQRLLRRRLPRAAAAVHLEPQGAGDRRPQDVEELRQRHRASPRPRLHPQEVHADVHRPAAAAAQRPGPPGGLQPVRVPQAGFEPRDPRTGRPRVPQRRRSAASTTRSSSPRSLSNTWRRPFQRR